MTCQGLLRRESVLRRSILAAILLGLLAAILLGCGGDEETEGDDESRLMALVDRVPRDEDFPAITAVDVIAAREALGVAEGTDPRTAITGGDAERRFAYAVASAVPYLQSPQDTPISEAVDSTQITAAASNVVFGPGSITVLETDQPFEEIASALEVDGYERDGNVVTAEADAIDPGASVVAEGDGIVALGFDAETVTGVATGDPAAPEGPERELIAQMAGPAKLATATGGESSSCLDAIGVVDGLADGAGEFVVLAEEPAAESFVLDDTGDFIAEPFDFAEPMVEDGSLSIPFTYPIDQPGGPGGLLLADLPAGTIYDCEAAT